ncbi:hypothetical protein LUZ63_009105 [Rhynchospora breviuscula]|uniref:F-box domain-containing protein n=1 Tax=Rhynchospora breviuscula TaxID=2022672 RepID=A0A9Q0CES9_9POAL|nr:hypothetical protein LUZ63_009105 [Rhynchospora breviuscula]
MEGLFSPIDSLPSDCVSHMISLASPRDACMFALASTGFRSVMDTDNTWQLFLPTDIDSILSQAVSPVLFSSKKDLLVKLCNQHVLIDGGNMSFGLDKSSGKKCYMLSPYRRQNWTYLLQTSRTLTGGGSLRQIAGSLM